MTIDSAPSPPAAAPRPVEEPAAHRSRRLLTLLAVAVLLAVGLVAAGIFGLVRSSSDSIDAPAADVDTAASGAPAVDSSIGGQIATLEARLERAPDDYTGWATLGIAYVQQARISVDPSLYTRAEQALDRSFEVNESANAVGYAGRSNLAAARHRFADAKAFAEQGLAINAFSPYLYGALADADTQLGDYDEAARNVQKMLDLSPDTSSFARASYTWELRGDTGQAVTLMERARDAAPNGDDRAFALYYLGELAFDQGDVAGALGHYNDAVAASPEDNAALAGRAKALATSGQVLTAVDAYAALVRRVPDPLYLVPYGRLLESLGRTDEADEQFRVAEVAWQLYAANGVEPDADQVLFVADHGDPADALALAETAVRSRPFLAVHDAYAWALYRNGRYADALEQSDTALELGTRNARFHFHAGMIRLAMGDVAAARDQLTTALDINPQFDPIDAAVATSTLAELGTG